MFDFDAGKLLIVGAVALIFIPPKDLPRVLRQAGQFVGKMKRMASEFQGQFMDAMREADMADLRREARELTESTRVDLGLDHHAKEIDRQIAGSIENTSAATREQVASHRDADGAVHAAEPDHGGKGVEVGDLGHADVSLGPMSGLQLDKPPAEEEAPKHPAAHVAHTA